MELPNLKRLVAEDVPREYGPRVLPASWRHDGDEHTVRGSFSVYRQGGGLVVLLSRSIDSETGEWLHLSVSHSMGPPSWSQLMEVRRVFFGDREAVMVIPRDSDEVDISKQLPAGARSPWHIWTRPWTL